MLFCANLFEGLIRHMAREESEIDGLHRKELLRFLLVKTAAVRRGVKPGELLRVWHCYEGMNEDGMRICLYRGDIYGILGLDYVELKVEKGSSLVLFYNPEVLAATLSEGRNARWLSRMGYPKLEDGDAGKEDGRLGRMLAHLVDRSAECALPHEVGIFIGYPLKDVAGFIRNIPSTPVHNGSWRVYGDAHESIVRMNEYAQVEAEAREALRFANGVDEFIDMISLKRAS